MHQGHSIEIHYGIVTDNHDEEKRGRLKVQCGTLAPSEGELPNWVEPLYPFLSSSNSEASDGGWLFTPDIGVVVELRVLVASPDDGRPGFSSVVAPNIRWQACVQSRGDDAVDAQFQINYPQRRGIKTGRGHVLLWDDTTGSELGQLSISHAGGTNSLVMDKDGVYLTSTSAIKLSATSVLADVGEFRVDQLGLSTPVLVDGALGLQALLATSLLELVGLIALPAPNTAALAASLQAGSFSSSLLFAE